MKEDKPQPQEPTAANEPNDVKAKDSEENVEASQTAKKAKKIWYKNPWFWVGVVAATIGVISITLGLIYRSNVLKTNQAISDGWFDITTQSQQVVVLQDKLDQTKDYNAYSAQLHTLQTSVSNRKYSASKLPTWLNNRASLDRYTNFLNSFDTYIGKAASLSDDPAKISSDDLSKLSDDSKSAEDATNNLKNNASFLQQDMPQGIFDVPSVLQKVTETIAANQAKTQAEKQAAANAAAKDAADQQAVTTSVTTFQNGFVAGNAAAMRPVMTSGFQNEYNFNQLSPDQRQYQYPASFRIISVTKQTDGTYKASVNVLFKYTDNSNQYTQGYEYSVISSSGKWLLNNEKQTNSF